MSKTLTFEQVVQYLNQGFNFQATGQSGMVTLKNSSQEDCLIFQSEDGGQRTSVFAPFLTQPQDASIQKALDLHLLHLNADIDTLGTLRISLNTDSKQYALCDGVLIAENLEDFVAHIQALLEAANYLRNELTEAISQAQENEGADFGSPSDLAHYLKA
jgi:hypothetical protein